MQVDTQTSSRATINDSSFGSTENDNFRDVFKTNESHNVSSSVESLLTAEEEIESIIHVEDPQINSDRTDSIAITGEQV